MSTYSKRGVFELNTFSTLVCENEEQWTGSCYGRYLSIDGVYILVEAGGHKSLPLH